MTGEYPDWPDRNAGCRRPPVQGTVSIQARLRPLAVLTTAAEIAGEVRFTPDGEDQAGVRPAVIGDYDVQVLTAEEPDGRPRPLAVLATPWIEQHLLLFARTLWRRR